MVDRRLWRTSAQSAKRPLSLISRKVVGGSSVCRNSKSTTGELARFGIRAGFRGYFRQANDAGVAHAVIDEHPVARMHLPDGAERLRVAHTVPNRAVVAGQVFDGICLRISLSQEVIHTYIYRMVPSPDVRCFT